MTGKTYQVSCKTPETSTQSVIAASCDVDGDHLVLLNSRGGLAAIFLLEIVESWSVTNMSRCAPENLSELPQWDHSEWPLAGAPKAS
jgi:hypothetical protein